MKEKLITFLLWLLRKLGMQCYAIPIEVMGMIPQIKTLCSVHDSRPESSEWKRHQVYALMQKSHPKLAKRDIALAIELAVRSMR